MTDQCDNLDGFFDGELAAEDAEAFTGHLATCQRCQAVLRGRVQEEVIVSLARTRAERREAPEEAKGEALADVKLSAPAASAWHHRLSRWGTAVVAGATGIALTIGVSSLICRPGASSERIANVGSGASGSLELALLVDSGKARMRGYNPHVGDRLFPSVRGDAYQAIWVFIDGRRRVTSCPGDPLCKNDNGELSLELELKSRGQYTIVAVGSTLPIDVPLGTYDSMMAEVTKPAANKHVQVQHVDVD